MINEKIQQLAEITKIEQQVKNTKEKLERSIQEKKVIELKLQTDRQKSLVAIFTILLFSGALFFFYYRYNSKKQLERQKQLNDELQELDHVKDRILTNTSHELRTPLNGIIGMAEVILMEHEEHLEPGIIDSINLIASSGEQLSNIVNDILDFAQLKSRKIKFNFIEFELSKVVDEVIRLCEVTSNNKQVKITFDIEKNLSVIFQDQKRVQQVLYNLIGNAIKFTDKGEIEIRAFSDDKHIWIEVKDTGIGIPQEKLNNVFRGFEQVDASNNRSANGSGLGLAICQELVTAMQGEIFLTSQIKIGTTVSFYLPKRYCPL